MTARLIVEQPAGSGNRYRADPAAGQVVLDAVQLDIPHALIERGHLAGTRGDDGRPLRAVVPVRLPTFAGCVIPVHPIGVLRPPRPAPALVIAVPTVDPALAGARAVADLPPDVRAAVLGGATGASLGDAEAAAAVVRAGIEAHLRARAEAARGEQRIPAWKVSDERAPIVDGREAQPHTFAEQAIPRLPARFQEYIARALLPDERVLMFIQRPVTRLGGGLRLRRTRLREGIFVLTDRQVMLMTDSLPPDSTLIHWGYIARLSAVERVADVQVRDSGPLINLEVTFVAARGAETVSFAFPATYAPAVADAAALVRGFIPATRSRAVRRVYAPAVPVHLPSLAEARPAGEAPGWARELLADEPLLAWAQAPAERRTTPAVVVGERSVVVNGAGRGRAPRERVALDDLTSLEMTLSLVGSGLEVGIGDGEAVRRVAVRFPYPAAPPFLTVVTAIRHLLGIAPEEHGRVRDEPRAPAGSAA